ncbi:hypothetical protein [Gramella sp. AN32]|uniref:Glycosyl hydrolases family 39 N-terminal catalytic domain-containing protein n=1 Tax=Christiangramia antarctica TaxID=2058158 RepID=A0ABW5X3J1_9FLAO|nr:hypothetical protein [Gramella sp. AN32]MCM4156719.1 hypothetical protein [Gramella sp. AN32]
MKRLTYYLFSVLLIYISFACRNQSDSGEFNASSDSKGIALDKLGKITPKNSSEISGSYWGIQASTLDPELLKRAADIGVKWTRLHCNWNHVEKVKGSYDWSETDKAFDAILKTGIVPFVTIGHGNPVYSEMTTYDDPKLAEIYGYRPAPPIKDPAAMKAWLAFVKAAIERYKDKITYWEVWNEPNHRNYWGGKPDGEEYGELLNQTAKIIRNIQPNARIIAGSMAGIDPEFAEAFLSIENNADLVDIITYHNYGAVPEERAYPTVRLLEVMKKNNPELKLWQGECGYPSHSSSRDYRGRAPWGLNIQAKWLLRQAFVDTYFCEATLSNYFKLVHMGGRGEKPERSPLTGLDTLFGYPERDGSRVKTKGVNEKCILTNPDLEPKPAYFTYQNLCALMDDSYKVFRTDHQLKVKDQGIFYGIGEEDDAFPSVPLMASFKTAEDNHLIAYWLPWNAQEYLPELGRISLKIQEVKFENPVLVDLLNGDVYELKDFHNQQDNVNFENLPIADYPFAIVERSQINFNTSIN